MARAHSGMCSGTGALPLSSTPSSTRKMSPSLRASALSPAPFLGRTSSSASLMQAAGWRSPMHSLRSASAHSLAGEQVTSSSLLAVKAADGPGAYDVDTYLREASFDLTSAKIDLQVPWDSHTRGDAVPWSTYRKRYSRPNGPLDLYRGTSGLTVAAASSRPTWVAEAPGTYSHSFERDGRRSKPRFGKPAWDQRFPLDHALDRNPVVNGMRRGLDNRVGVGVRGSRDPLGGDPFVLPL